MSIIKFWKKDIINKMIVITGLLIAAGVTASIILFFNLPAGTTWAGFIADILPSKGLPTLGPSQISTPAIAQSPTATVEMVYVPTFTPFTSLSPTSTLELETNTPVPILELPSPTIVPTQLLTTRTPTAVAAPVSAGSTAACIPNNTPQSGKVVEILDGNTSRVLINGLVYVVRYIGVDVPTNKYEADAAKRANMDMVYGKDVKLIAGETDKDSRGRLLRYVLAGNSFINLDLIQKGIDPALPSTTTEPCNQVFYKAEQSAKSAGIGIWIYTPTPQKP